MTRRACCGLIVIAAFAVLGAGTQPPNASAPPALAPGITARLEALQPEDPGGYFLLAEELADTAAEETEKALPRALYVLAFDLGRRKDDAGALALEPLPVRGGISE